MSGLVEKTFGKIFRAIGWRAYSYADRIDPPPTILPTAEELLMSKWIADKGDKSLRQVYELKENDVVMDVGGFEGQWASDIFSRYGCTIHIFEPVPVFAQNIRDRFAGNRRIFVYQTGLGCTSGLMDITVNENASSQFINDGVQVTAPIIGLDEFFAQSGIVEVALMKINIEGGEYALLEGLLAGGNISRIRELQIQFHEFIPDAAVRMKCIQDKLSLTHHLSWQYPFIWENWRRTRS